MARTEFQDRPGIARDSELELIGSYETVANKVADLVSIGSNLQRFRDYFLEYRREAEANEKVLTKIRKQRDAHREKYRLDSKLSDFEKGFSLDRLDWAWEAFNPLMGKRAFAKECLEAITDHPEVQSIVSAIKNSDPREGQSWLLRYLPFPNKLRIVNYENKEHVLVKPIGADPGLWFPPVNITPEEDAIASFRPLDRFRAEFIQDLPHRHSVIIEGWATGDSKEILKRDYVLLGIVHDRLIGQGLLIDPSNDILTPELEHNLWGIIVLGWHDKVDHAKRALKMVERDPVQNVVVADKSEKEKNDWKTLLGDEFDDINKALYLIFAEWEKSGGENKTRPTQRELPKLVKNKCNQEISASGAVARLRKLASKGIMTFPYGDKIKRQRNMRGFNPVDSDNTDDNSFHI